MANTFVLTYDANGGTNAPEAQSITTGASSAEFTISSTKPQRSSEHLRITATCNTQGGSSVTAPSYYKHTSFYCESWNDNSSGSGTNYYSGGSIRLYANKTIYAKWRVSTYYTSITLPSPYRSGYSFSGWYSAATGGMRYGGGGSSYTPTSDTLTMYAQWVANQYTISYNANGGTGAPASQQKAYGSSIKLSTTIPTLSGHSFLGWATSSSNAQNGQVAYAPGATYSENVGRTLYAVWQENYVLLYFDPDQYSDQTSYSTVRLYQHGGVMLPTARFTRDGRVQTGWIRSSDRTHFALGESYSVYEEAHFTPEWSYPASAVTATNGTMGSDTDKVMITIDDNGHNYLYYVRARMGSNEGIVASGTISTSFGYKPPISLFASQVPDAKGGTLTITCRTVNGYNHTVGTTSTTCYVSVPDTVKCTVGSIALAETVSGINEQFGGFVQGQSKAQVTITGSTSGAYGATVVGYGVDINGETSTDNPYTTGLLRDSGTNSVTATVTDTRGYSDSLTQTYSVYPWYSPSIKVAAGRTTTGTISLYYTWDIAAVNDSNTKSIKFSYRPYGSSSDPTVAATITPATYSGSGTRPITGLPANTAYEIYAEVTDFFTSIVASTMVPGVDGRIFHMSSTDRTVARHGANPSDGWDHQFFDERFHGDVDIDGDETVGGTLGVTGATTLADATVSGALSVTNRRAAVNSASAGWHRVLEFAPNTATHRLGRAGLIIDFDITRFSTDNETHKISLSLIETNARFMGEESNSNTQLIDKIRYIYDNSKGYVDIHFSSSLSSYVAVDYQVSGCGAGYLAKVHTMTLAAVADTPSGETVLTEYALNANGTYENDLVVNGVLDVTKRRCYATLSSAGWYRVMQYTTTTTGAQWGTGVKIDFAITTAYNNTNNSLHDISMVGVYHNVAFVNELSYSNATIVDKIRYTYGDDGNGYVDIHYNNSKSNLVYVDFVVHYRQERQTDFSSVALTSVADSPSGETVMTEYSFAANTDIAKTEFTPTNATAYSSYGNCYYERQGRIVHVHIGVSGLTADAITIIASLPSEIIPSTKILAYGMGGSFTLGAMCRIEANGSVQVCSEGTYALCDFVYMV